MSTTPHGINLDTLRALWDATWNRHEVIGSKPTIRELEGYCLTAIAEHAYNLGREAGHPHDWPNE